MSYQLTDADDSMHVPSPDQLFWTETIYLGFSQPERNLAGIIYPIVRPNQGVCSLGIYVWDSTGDCGQDILYLQNFWHLPAPRDLRNFDLPVGFSHHCVEPFKRYVVRYDDGAELSLDLEYESLHQPVGRGTSGVLSSYNQLYRVTGVIRLNGDELDVDCCELRGQFWGTRSDARRAARPDLRSEQMGFSDTYAATPKTAFFIGTSGDHRRTEVHSGFLFKDGQLTQIVEGERTVTRSGRGYPMVITVSAMDEDGRRLHVVGRSANRFRLEGVPGIPNVGVWSSLMRWEVDGEIVWGKDDDVPVGLASHFLSGEP
jgi:hypothetical protein